MYTSGALLDIHDRSQRSLIRLMEHCAEMPAESIDREHDGFGYPTVRLQLHHLLGAQEYWIGVLQGRVEADENDHLYPTIASLQEYRGRVAAQVRDYLESVDDAALNESAEYATWGGRTKILMPAQVVLRTVMHLYHHQGQIQAICRQAGVRIGRLDFPLD
jgi:uncharacterized damage-inducible protein DinB